MFLRSAIIFAVVFMFSGCENTVNSKNMNDAQEPSNDESEIIDHETIDENEEIEEKDSDQDEETENPDLTVDEKQAPDTDIIWDNCSNNWDCESDEMCVLETGKCSDAWGHCEKIPENCDDIDDPVCGCDGISYSNECEARMNGKNIRHRGVCTD